MEVHKIGDLAWQHHYGQSHTSGWPDWLKAVVKSGALTFSGQGAALITPTGVCAGGPNDEVRRSDDGRVQIVRVSTRAGAA